MKWLALSLIRLYQRTISRVLPPSCRFVPSCSEYGHEAITRYGVIRGGIMATWRVLRCNPWGGHGYDPVPDLGQRAANTDPTPGTSGERHGINPQSSCCPKGARSPQSFLDSALTPHAPGHSLTEG
jgi:putative membrane protein insertion efficiency factor